MFEQSFACTQAAVPTRHMGPRARDKGRSIVQCTSCPVRSQGTGSEMRTELSEGLALNTEDLCILTLF